MYIYYIYTYIYKVKTVKSIANLMQRRMNVGMVARLLYLHQKLWKTKKGKKF